MLLEILTDMSNDQFAEMMIRKMRDLGAPLDPRRVREIVAVERPGMTRWLVDGLA
jgi:hypothetical protein